MTGVDVLARTLPSLALIVGALLLLRHWAGRTRGSADVGVHVVARTGIAKNNVVAIVAVGDRRLLVGASEQGISLLAELDRETRDGPTHEPAAHEPLGAARSGDLSPPPEHLHLTPSELSWTTDRPRMASIDRLRRLTVRQAVPSSPRRPYRAHRRT